MNRPEILKRRPIFFVFPLYVPKIVIQCFSFPRSVILRLFFFFVLECFFYFFDRLCIDFFLLLVPFVF